VSWLVGPTCPLSPWEAGISSLPIGFWGQAQRTGGRPPVLDTIFDDHVNDGVCGELGDRLFSNEVMIAVDDAVSDGTHAMSCRRSR